ncbi:hypothetical protein ACMFMG_004713 [Clarireedia jacksonii]
MLVECVKHKIFDALMIVPPQIEELATNSEALLSISQKAETMFYAGGDVSLAAGDAISLQMKLITICGSIEQGFWHTLHPTGPWNPKIWKYMRPHPAQKVAFRHQSEDLYEATADDMRSFITAEKFYPTQMERIIGAHPGVNAVLFVGTRRPKGALLVELRNPSDDKEVFLDSLWPLVEEANKPVSFTAKITKDMMLITDAELPMARSMKGTIERRSTVKLYKERLDVL